MKQRADLEPDPVAPQAGEPAPIPVPALIALQRTAGNQAVMRHLRTLARYVDEPAAEAAAPR